MTTPHPSSSTPPPDRQTPMSVRLAGLGVPLVVLLLVAMLPTRPRSPASQAPDTVLAGVIEHWPPQYVPGSGGRPAGFAVDVMEDVARRTSLGVRYRTYRSFPEAIEGLRAGEVDLIPNLGILESREEEFEFTRPVETFSVVLFVREGVDAERLSDLGDHSVGVVERNVGQEIVASRETIDPVVYPDSRSALFGLAAGEVDALVFPEPVLLGLARSAGIEGRIRPVGEPLAHVRRGMAVREGEVALLGRLDSAVAEYLGSDEHERAMLRWYGGPEAAWSPRRVLVGGAFVLVLLLLGAGAWRHVTLLRFNEQLRRSVEARKAAEEALREQEDRLRRTQRLEAVGRLAGGVAHDFNNLLTGISGFTQLIMGETDPEDPIRKDLEEIQRSTDRAASLTRKLLTFARREEGESHLLDLAGVVEEMERILRRLVGERVELVVELDPGGGLVRADPGELEEVVMNLVLNARDAMPVGGRVEVDVRRETVEDPRLTRYTGTLEPGRYVVLEVEDEGEGIDPGIGEHLFEPYYSTKDPAKGTGLGLATVHGIVTKTGGHIEVETSDQGTTFRAYFPAVEAEEEEAPEERAGSELTEGGSETILVVEDEDAIRTLARRILERAGHTVFTAADGKEALSIFRRSSAEIDLVVSDVIMPEMGGRELARQVEDIRPGTDILLMSGYAEDEVSAAGTEAAAWPLFHKPFTPDELVRRIREVLNHGASP